MPTKLKAGQTLRIVDSNGHEMESTVKEDLLWKGETVNAEGASPEQVAESLTKLIKDAKEGKGKPFKAKLNSEEAKAVRKALIEQGLLQKPEPQDVKLLPVPQLYCSICKNIIAMIDPKLIAKSKNANALRKNLIKLWTGRRTMKTEKWMTTGKCPDLACVGRWWFEETQRLNIRVPTTVIKKLEREKEAQKCQITTSPTTSP